MGISVFDRLVVPRSVSTSVPSPGTIVLHVLTLNVIYRLAPGAYVGVSQPFGMVRIRAAKGPWTTQTGNGDLYFFGGQDLMSLGSWRTRERPSLSIVPYIGASVPTGQYVATRALSTELLLGSEDGSLALVSHDTDASLGSGALSVRGGIDVDHQLVRWLGWNFDATVNVPVTRTRKDGIWWPNDWMVSFELRAHAGPALGLDGIWWDRLSARIGLDGRVSSHEELAARFSLSYQVRPDAACDVRVRVPVHARASSIALAESLSAQVGCYVDVGGS
ncbi:MAG: hypothetical protein IPK13_03645 [Deltaproteobacteria bacterium]|nr:hypothetical protein [Deltaproteobacteria bacterium]